MRMEKRRLLSVYILEILNKYSSSQSALSQKDILMYLDKEYGVEITRKTLSEYLNELRDKNFIVGQKGVYKEKIFSDNELRLLIDGVLFGQHIPEPAANELISKLKNFSQNSMNNRIKHVCYLERINHTRNNKLYEILDIIDEAIERNKKVELTLCAFDINGMLYDWGTKIVDPYYLVTDKCRYYLICYAGRNGDLENRRLDRISKAKILDEIRIPISTLGKYSNGFDLADYMKTHIYMFSGESKAIVIRVRKKNIGDLIDWYGGGFRILENDSDYVTVRLDANENAVFYWALQYGQIAEIIKPIQLRERIKDTLANMLEQYKK